MGSGTHGLFELGTTLQFPTEYQSEFNRQRRMLDPGAHGGFGTNPIFAQTLAQLLQNLQPRVQRTRLRRSMANVAGGLGRGTEQAVSGLRETMAARGMGSSGAALGLEGMLRQQEGEQLAGLRGAYQEELLRRQEAARQEALSFLQQILGLRLGIAGAGEQVLARHAAGQIGPLDIFGAIAGGLGSLGTAAAGFKRAGLFGGASAPAAALGAGMF